MRLDHCTEMGISSDEADELRPRALRYVIPNLTAGGRLTNSAVHGAYPSEALREFRKAFRRDPSKAERRAAGWE